MRNRKKSTITGQRAFAEHGAPAALASTQSIHPQRKTANMETAIVLIILALIATLVMPDLLSKEILIALVAFGVISVVQPNLLSREQIFAFLTFGILFTLVIPPLLK